MNLDEPDCQLFYKLNFTLLAYLNNRLSIVTPTETHEDFNRLTMNDKAKVRNALYQNMELLDSFVRENPYGLNRDEIEIVAAWRHFVQGRFLVIKYLKNFSVFLAGGEPPAAYGVLALMDRFEDMIGPPPVMIETVLLPYRDKIVYDGLLNPYPVRFGSGSRQGFNEEYVRARSLHGIITSLPRVEKQIEPDNETLLRYYLKNERNRELHWDEICRLVEKHERMLFIFHEEMGKAYARSVGRRLKEMGVRDAWFAILENLIVASGAGKAECEETVKEILPPEKARFVYYHRVKG